MITVECAMNVLKITKRETLIYKKHLEAKGYSLADLLNYYFGNDTKNWVAVHMILRGAVKEIYNLEFAEDIIAIMNDIAVNKYGVIFGNCQPRR